MSCKIGIDNFNIEIKSNVVIPPGFNMDEN